MPNHAVMQNAASTQKMMSAFAGVFAVVAVGSFFGMEPSAARNFISVATAIFAALFGLGAAANGRLKRDASM